jgi:hypothetical protein
MSLQKSPKIQEKFGTAQPGIIILWGNSVTEPVVRKLIEGRTLNSMTRLFMLEFNYEGERYFANVIEYRHSPAVYYVNLINAAHIRPRKLILEEVDGKIKLSQDSLPARKALVDSITKRIEEYIQQGAKG